MSYQWLYRYLIKYLINYKQESAKSITQKECWMSFLNQFIEKNHSNESIRWNQSFQGGRKSLSPPQLIKFPRCSN